MSLSEKMFRCKNKECEIYNETQGDWGIEEIKNPKCICGEKLI